MKPIPEHIIASAPSGTEWFGGAVDRSKMTLRVATNGRGESLNKAHISTLLGCESDRAHDRFWCLHAPDMKDADLNVQVDWILSRVSRDLVVWKTLAELHRVDIFCGLFLDRSNRGISLSAKTMTELGARGIEIGFDIYSPEA